MRMNKYVLMAVLIVLFCVSNYSFGNITYPEYGAVLYGGSTITVQWDATEDYPLAAVDIYKPGNSPGLDPSKLDLGIYSGSADIYIPTEPGNYYIRVFEVMEDYNINKSVPRISMIQVQVVSQPIATITITSPSGGESFTSCSSAPIAWTSTGSISSVNIQYSTNNGTSWQTIESNVINVTGNNTYNWTLLDTPSTQCKIKVSNSSNSSIFGISNTFTIKPTTITFMNPTDGEKISRGKTAIISWKSTGCSKRISLEYSNIDTLKQGTLFSNSSSSSGTYNWNVPSTFPIGEYTLLIKDATSGTHYASAYFTITDDQPKVGLPNGGEVFEINKPITFSWSSTGDITSVNIYFSTNGGASWTSFATGMPPTGSTNFISCNEYSNSCRIKVTDAANENVYDTSDGDFTIKPPTITVDVPNSGNPLCPGTQQSITWSDSGCWPNAKTIQNVKIDFYNGSGWSNIIPSTPNTRLYSWNVPNAPSTQCKIRISDASNSSIISESGSFEIKAKSITINSPNGYSYCPGDTIPISWTSQCVSSFKIEYAPVNTSNWQPITTTTSSPYNWNPSNLTSGTYIVRVTDVNGTVSDQKTFTLLSKDISITSPQGGIYCAGDNLSVAWTSQCVSRVKIEYSINNSPTWQIVTSSTQNTNSFPWTVPIVPFETICIRVSDASDGTIYDTVCLSCPQLTISGRVTFNGTGLDGVTMKGLPGNPVTAGGGYYSASVSYNWSGKVTPQHGCYSLTPSFTDYKNVTSSQTTNYTATKSYSIGLTSSFYSQYCPGDPISISWTPSNCIQNVNIAFSSDNGNSWQTFASNVPSVAPYTYSWTIPNTPSTQCKIKISDASDASIYSISDVFAIKSPSITIDSPLGGENALCGDSLYISWQSQCVSNVKVQYASYSSSTWYTITSSTTSPGSIYWNIPPSLSGTYKLRVVDLNNGVISNIVTINIRCPYIKVTSPNGGEIFCVGSQKTIRWSFQYISYVNIYYTINGGSTWQVVDSNVLNNNSYNWTVPNTPSTQCRIKVTDASNETIVDSSDNNFEIRIPSITVGSPNGGETFCVGSQQSITWSSTTACVSANVKIEYTTDNGSSWQSIIVSTPNTGSYTWLVPNTPSTQCKVRISDASNGTIVDSSNNNFEIKAPFIDITSHTEGTILRPGSNVTIQWTAQCVTDFSIAYSINNGTTWNSIDTTTNTSYNWTVTNVSFDTICIKVSKASDGTISDRVCLNNPQLTISGRVTYNGSGLKDVTINGLPGNPSTNDDGYYSATVPYGWSSSASAPVTPENDAYIFTPQSTAYQNVMESKTANYTAVLKKFITVSSPNGNEKWEAGTIHPITWKSEGITGDIRIDYTTDNGASSWTAVKFSTPNTGSFDWTIPNTISTQCKIRITSLTDSTITDDSDNTFTIYKSLSSAERRALIDLYIATDGDHWTNNSAWKTPPLYTDGFAMPGTENSWFGVTIANGHVYQINLPQNNLIGTLPDSLCDLTAIQSLYLVKNTVSGTIPDKWTNNTEFKSLYLSSNKLTGPLPSTFGNLSQLLYLDLSNNQLTGSIPDTYENLGYLRNLVIEHNSLEGSIPTWIGNLIDLRFIDLAYNKFTGSIPPSMGNLSNLKELYLDYNKLSGSIPDTLGNLYGLKVLFLGNNQLTGTIPTTLGNLSNLNYLHIDNNKLEGTIPNSLGNLTKIISLYVRSNKLEGEIPSTLTNLTNLTTAADFGYNALFTANSSLLGYLSGKDSDWQDTQTVAPFPVNVQATTGNSVTLSWSLITYKYGNGGYEVYYSTTSGGPYTLFGTTEDKTITSMIITGLNPATTYYFVVKTKTAPHWNNTSTVVSVKSSEVSAVTAPF